MGDRCRLPGSPLSLGQLVSGTSAQVRQDGVTVLAGNVAFRLMFAALPTLVALIWVLRIFEADRLVQGLLDLARLAFPGPAIDPIEQQIRNAPADQSSGRLTTGVGFSVVVSLWAVAIAFRAAMHALNVVYGVEDQRSQLRRLAMSALVAVITIAMFLTALVLIVFGSTFAEGAAGRAGLGVGFRLAWAATSWLVIIACVFAAFAGTYYFAPDVDQRVRWVGPGSIAGVALWLSYTMLFSLYVNTIADPQETYGALAGVAVFMLYLYGSTWIVLVGAEMNQVIEDADPEGKNTGDKAPSPSPAERTQAGAAP